MANKPADENPQERPIQVVINQLEGEFVTYANMCGVIFTPDEAVLHFAVRDLQDPTQGGGVALIYTSLPHAKRLASALVNTVIEHERKFGEIVLDVSERLTPEARQELEASRAGNS